jgi:hypothetical protein
MNKYLKSPIFYMIIMPIAAGLWMLYGWAIAYPASVQKWQDSKDEYKEAQNMLKQILTLEPQRLTFKPDKTANSGFDYTNVIGDFTNEFKISPDNYTLNVRGVTKREGKSIKGADLTIKTIDIEKLCRFLSAVLARWPELDCDTFRLDKLETGKNSWKVTLHFTYSY